MAHSPVLAALHHVYDLHPENQWSWVRLNHALQGQLEVLILVGAPFALSDFATLAQDRRLAFGFWAGDGGEHYYHVAVKADNRSACLSFERWKQRKPFIWEGKRLYLGAELRWKDEWVTLTSFAPDGLSITLCSYLSTEIEKCPTCHRAMRHYERKIKHRAKVTLDALHKADVTRTKQPAPTTA